MLREKKYKKILEKGKCGREIVRENFGKRDNR
jgi:hypothetical protein